MLAAAQRLRGRIYLEDGAIEASQLTSDGRYCTEGDASSWHLLSVDEQGNVGGCARYRAHANSTSFSRLGVRHAAHGQGEAWTRRLRWAVEGDLQLARKRKLAYVEVGGWALRDDLRYSMEAIRIALGAFALARHLGGCIGVTTATTRHGSETILRRIGGRALQAGGSALESYYDPRYKCEMRILGFDSAAPNARYQPWIDEITREMVAAMVLSGASSSSADRVAGARVGRTRRFLG